MDYSCFRYPAHHASYSGAGGVTADSIVTMHSSVPRLVLLLVVVLVSLVTCSDSDSDSDGEGDAACLQQASCSACISLAQCVYCTDANFTGQLTRCMPRYHNIDMHKIHVEEVEKLHQG